MSQWLVNTEIQRNKRLRRIEPMITLSENRDNENLSSVEEICTTLE